MCFLLFLVLYLLTGDLNIHLDAISDASALRLTELLQSFGLVQSVEGSTHRCGHTLDVVITRDDLPIPTVSIDAYPISDHHLVSFHLPLQRPPIRAIDVSTRAWKKFDADKFKCDLLQSDLCGPDTYENLDTDTLQNLYDSILSVLLDKHAPRRRIKGRYQPMTPWFDTECSAARRKTRLFERRYRRSQADADRLIWTTQVRAIHRLYVLKQNSYWTSQVNESNGNSRELWKTLSAVLCKEHSRNSNRGQSNLSAETFVQIPRLHLIRISMGLAVLRYWIVSGLST